MRGRCAARRWTTSSSPAPPIVPRSGGPRSSLTIDNTAGLLPIEFTEVTITRTLFRTGESEYLINGVPCRLLDIQELLSDTGIGRQQHVIVGQGQLDAVLNARPEDRRAIIEEAAGILKFRKRKEKAERRLEATEGNLLRLTDLLREVRRQLRPLERQADAARRHDGLVDELRAVTLHLAGREIDQLADPRAAPRRSRGATGASEEQDVRVQLRGLDDAVLDAEHALAVPGDDDVADLLARTEALRERSRGLVNLVAERAPRPRPRARRGRRRRRRRDARRRSGRARASSCARSTPTSRRSPRCAPTSTRPRRARVELRTAHDRAFAHR